MGKTGKGILDQFNGKVGTVVGSIWKDKFVMKSAPRKKANPKFTLAQLDQQAKYTIVGKHLKSLAVVVSRGFTDGGRKLTAYNAAMQDALDHALTGTYPDYSLDWSKLKVSRGRLLPSSTSSVVVTGTNIQFTWSTETPPEANSRDKVLMVVYSPVLEVCYWDIASTRDTGTAAINAGYFTGQVVQIYIGFITEKGDRSSVSSYLGQFTL